ncbi:alpha/beta hydrolase [Gordonia sp. 'Campus']|uniref:alpha/beta hydrolase n=1 Tax=Gordonia sp. 'Campus' TaxID=2915824 RepID=UPI001EE4BF6D|nr:alpha/beta hydrolase [Gordonia sp. 'Campus']
MTLPPASAPARREQMLTRLTVRPLMRRLPLSRTGVAALRAIVAAPSTLDRVVPGTRIESVHNGPVRGEWVAAPGVRRDGPVILYVHGSAFVLLSARSHRALVSRLSDRTGLPVFSVDYRLAPEHPFPAATEDVRAAYDFVLGRGSVDKPDEVIVAGDSAGAHLCVDLALQLVRSGSRTPAGLVLFSPLIDLTLGLATEQETLTPDPLTTAADCRRLIGLYVGDTDPADPRIAFTFDDVDGFPPTFIQTGANEMLQADARHLHRSISATGTAGILQVWPGQAHVFQASTRIPEAAAALRAAATFIVEALASTSAAQRG